MITVKPWWQQQEKIAEIEVADFPDWKAVQAAITEAMRQHGVSHDDVYIFAHAEIPVPPTIDDGRSGYTAHRCRMVHAPGSSRAEQEQHMSETPYGRHGCYGWESGPLYIDDVVSISILRRNTSESPHKGDAGWQQPDSGQE